MRQCFYSFILHSSGIGVDDMFVIVQALENLSEEDKKKPIPERIGLTMKSAGVAITVTSMTDILAFAAGAVTVSNYLIWRDTYIFSDFEKHVGCKGSTTTKIMASFSRVVRWLWL